MSRAFWHRALESLIHGARRPQVSREARRKKNRQRFTLEQLEVRAMLSGTPLAVIPDTSGLWHLDEGSGGTAVDTAGFNNGALANGPAWVSGAAGYAQDNALSFDGVDDYVLLKNGPILGSAANFTVEAWVKWDGGGTTHQHQFIYSEGSYNDIIDLYLDNGRPSFTTLGANWYTASAAAALPVGQWHHLAGVLQAGVGGTLYVDGQAVATNASMGPGSQFAGSTNIGRFAGNGSLRYFRGAIDEVRVLTVARSASEIQADYQQGLNADQEPEFVATGGFTFEATEGTLSAIQTVATFTGSGGAEAVGNYTANIDWGDGGDSSPGTISFSNNVFAVSGSHLYAEHGSYNVVTTISEVDDGQSDEAWVTNAAMPTPRWASAAGAINGVIYVAGGYNGSHLQTVQAYNTATNTWSNKNNKPAVQTNTAYGVINNILYTAGGTNNSVEITSLYAYNPTNDTWAPKASVPGVARQNSGGAVSNDLFYMMGGFSLGNHTSLNYAYNPAANTWSNALAPMPTARSGLAVAAVNGTLYAIGGIVAGSGVTSTVEAYDPVSNTWATKAPMPTARGDLDVAVVDGIIYAIGGTNYTTEFATVESYDPATNAWTTRASLPTARIALETVAVNGVIYAVGGYNTFPGSAALGTNESFNPAEGGDNTSTTSTLNFDAVNASAGPVEASNYLGGYGITLSAVTAGTAIDIVNNQSLYGGVAASPSSAPNLLTQLGSNNPVTYTLNFATPLTSFGFTRATLVAGPSGITHPQWSAHAFNASGQEVATVGESLIASYSNVPAHTFTLTGSVITSVRFDSYGYNFAAFSAVLIDDLTFTTIGGTTSVSATSVAQVSAANHSPTAVAFGPYTDNEGGHLLLDGSHSSDPDQPNTSLIYQWDLDADGIFGETGGDALQGDETGMFPMFSAAGLDGPSTYGIQLRVVDDGGLSSTDTAIINITNWAPNANFSHTSDASLGAPVSVSFSDPHDLSPADVEAGFHYAFALEPSALADATYDNSGADPTATFTFSDGLFQHTVYGRILDQDGDYTDYSTVVHAWLLTPPTPVEGISTGRVVVFTFSGDEEDHDTVGDGTIHWGDGSTSLASMTDGSITRNADGTFSAWGEHTYLHAATDLIFGVSGNGEESESFSALIDVANAPLSLVSLMPPVATQGVATGPVVVARFTDDNPFGTAAEYTATITWGDGSTSTASAADGTLVPDSDGSFQVIGNHTYASAATGLTFAVSIHDEDGGETGGSATMDVASVTNQPPVAHDDHVTAASTTVTLNVLANDTDVDGNALQVINVSPGANGTAVLNSNGTITYTVQTFFSAVQTFSYTVSDGHGGTDTATVTVTVDASVGILSLATQISQLSLNGGEKKSLGAKLTAAQESAARGNYTAATKQLKALVNEIGALQRSHRLNEATANLLVLQLETLMGSFGAIN